MKTLNKILGIALLAFLFTSCAPGRILAQQEGEYISDQQFYDELQPYGTWIYDQQYGNVWIPDVDEDFKPYATRGYWAMTDAGNTWVSDYPWGWAAFHYGRWHYDNYYGWEWSPGSEWAPAWVNWRDGGGYYGWAPMEPNINYDNGSYYDDNNYAINDNYWVFAPYAYINYPNVYNYYVPYNRVNVIIRNTNWVRNRYTYNNHSYYSPRREDIQRYSNRPVRVYNITNVSRPSRTTVNNNNINVYRPGVRANTNARPARVVDGAAYRQQNPAQRIGGGTDRNRGPRYNPANASKLAEAARTNNPDGKIVRVNNNNANVDGRQNTNPVNSTRPGASQGNTNPANNNGVRPGRGERPAATGDAQQPQHNIDRQQGNAQQQQMRQQREQQRQQREQQTQQQQQATQQQTDQQKQVAEQQRQQQQQAREQQRQQQQQQGQRPGRGARPGVNDDAAQAQQREQARQQQVQQQQVRQQQDQQRQQQQVQQQQQQQVRQQQEQQVRQQQDQQQQQQQQQARQQQEQQARQQQDQQRQQQEQQARQQQEQQARQQQEQQRQQQQDQQRQQQQQQQARQQQEQQRQQQQEQQRQQQEQQRQQQQEQQRQQRQQQEQQRQQQQPAETAPAGGGRPARN